MPMPIELVRQLSEEQVTLVKHSNLKAQVLEPGHVRLCMPLTGNQNQIDRLQSEAQSRGKADYLVAVQLTDASGEIVAECRGLYQLRTH
jgi:hypothetical protein